MADIHLPSGAPGAYEKITPGDVATGITASKLENSSGQQASGAVLKIEANTVNIAVDGGTATNAAGTNYGMQFASNDTIVLNSIEAVKNLSIVDTVSGSAGVVKVTIFFSR